MQDQPKEWQLIEKLLLSNLDEQKKKRWWRTFFLLLFFVYIGVIIFLIRADKDDLGAIASPSSIHTAVIRIRGPIMETEVSNAGSIIKGLRRAFKATTAKAVMLYINSPGGSPVQAGYVADEIARLKSLHPDKKVYAVISDLGASAAYYIASSADEIYADKSSLVGSIGVISESFGFTQLMDKVGIERRLIVAGQDKAFLDPFSPLKTDDKKYWQQTLATVHEQFIQQVKKGRGDRLIIDDKTFSGRVWAGETALAKGLIDGLGSASFVARERIGAEKIIDYSIKQDPIDKILQRVASAFSKEIDARLDKSPMNLSAP